MSNCECDNNVTMVSLKNVKLGLDLSGLEGGGKGGGEADYSYEEHETGAHWVDGSKIYRRVVDFGALPNSTSKELACPIDNLKNMVRVSGYASSGGSGCYALPYANPTPAHIITLTYTHEQTIKIYAGKDRRHHTAYVILEYTCTDR